MQLEEQPEQMRQMRHGLGLPVVPTPGGLHKQARLQLGQLTEPLQPVWQGRRVSALQRPAGVLEQQLSLAAQQQQRWQMQPVRNREELQILHQL